MITGPSNRETTMSPQTCKHLRKKTKKIIITFTKMELICFINYKNKRIDDPKQTVEESLVGNKSMDLSPLRQPSKSMRTTQQSILRY
jgi:hypothetical protein